MGDGHGLALLDFGFRETLRGNSMTLAGPFSRSESRSEKTRSVSSITCIKNGGQPLELGALKLSAGAKALAKFEECLERLEKIVQELEKGEVPLEKSLTLFEEGMQLSTSCRKELEQAEGKVEILLKKNGKLQAEPFEPLTEKAPARR
jgi:exodeoxyribonuclease VII small subunit